ncbi:MAG: LacI family DNA-binding transcriptional regulator [Clostridia bacterium]
MAATIKDVARRAQLSISTVSKYLNGLSIREDNRLRIEEAVDTLDFRVNAMARGLRTHRTMTVGVLIPNLEVSFFTELVSHIERTLQQHNYCTILCDYALDPALLQARMRFLREKSVDALIIVPLGLPSAVICEMQDAHIPVILVDRAAEDRQVCDVVLADNLGASREATRYLLERGHRRIGVLCGPQHILTARERLQGYREAHGAYGVAVDEALVLCGEYDMQSAHDRTQSLMLQSHAPTALFVTNHDMMVGTVLAVNEMALRIPEDLSLIGFDNQQLAHAVRPQLAHVLQPVKQMGEMVASLALRRMHGDDVGLPSTLRLTTTFYPGKSVGNLRQEG